MPGVYETEDGVPILNGITNLVKLGEAAVKLRPDHRSIPVWKKCVYAAAAAGPDRDVPAAAVGAVSIPR